MTGCISRYIILKEVNIVLKKNKTLKRLHIEYFTLPLAPVLRHGNWSAILKLESIQRRVTKIIKRVKDYSHRGDERNYVYLLYMKEQEQHRNKQVRSLITPLYSHSEQYFGKSLNSLITSHTGLNSTTVVLPQEWLWC